MLGSLTRNRKDRMSQDGEKNRTERLNTLLAVALLTATPLFTESVDEEVHLNSDNKASFAGQRHWPKVMLALPLEALLALMGAVVRCVGVNPGDDADKLLTCEIGPAGLLAHPFDQPASMGTKGQRRCFPDIGRTGAAVQMTDQALVDEILIGLVPQPSRRA